mgnify:CR=1 FL=1
MPEDDVVGVFLRQAVAEHAGIELARVAVKIGYRPAVSRGHQDCAERRGCPEEFLHERILGAAHINQRHTQGRLHALGIVAAGMGRCKQHGRRTPLRHIQRIGCVIGERPGRG